ncbi:hypothetical protein CCACVL1_05378 [Corchorus capsularis]|uniref:RPM1 interacting protein 13 n=1 Tax=Corchorus capsularis TaxID=210143 RepID=A0A1R3JKY6_COCAP|nr:hypothetical protein CCACVL1_05378 [Corchorus capsularis]
MESNPLVFDISSDDDEPASAWEDPKGDDYDWLSKVLEDVGNGFDDPDEVIVVGEVNNPNKKLKSSTVTKVVDEDDDDDDDCVVLEGDPDKTLSDVTDAQEGSDDLLIVGHKGPIACRDFPHPRHDCAKFPFNSTSHEQHCELCHCFVCDTPAPCQYWGSSISKVDHCHATDKEETWKTLRKTFRHGSNVALPVSKGPVISQSTAVSELNQAPRRNIIRLTSQTQLSRATPTHNIIRLTSQNQVSRATPIRAAGNCIPQNNVPRPPIMRACSSSSRYGMPYNPSVGGRHVLSKNIMLPRSVPQQFLGVNNTVIRRDRGIKISNLGSQFVSSNSLSKTLDYGVAPAMNQSTYVPSENFISASESQYQLNSASAALPNDGNPVMQNFGSGTNLGIYQHQSSSQPKIDSVFTHSAPSQSIGYNLSIPQSNDHPDTNQLQNQHQPATNYRFSDLDSWVNNISQSNQQSSGHCLPLQTLGSTNEEEAFKGNNEREKSYYNEFESLLLDNETVPEDPVTPGFNALSPDHISFDTGMLFFDIDTSWDRLTHA